MAYDSKSWGRNSDSGGPYPDAPKGNTKWPQGYTGNYSQPRATGPIVGQSFRRDLPAKKSGDDAMTDEANGKFDSTGPSFDNILKKWR
jgi:hypothetical protein